MKSYSALYRFKLRTAYRLNGQWQNAAVSHPELVHRKAKIAGSTLNGKIFIGRDTIIKDCFFYVRELYIGRNTSLWGPNISIHANLNPIKIGSFCSVAKNVALQEYNHRLERCSTYFFSSNIFNEGMEADIVSNGPITIGNDVWIASNVVVGSGATIGDGAVIGANSLVLGEIPPYAVAAGNPAKVIRYRFDQEIIERLLDIRWWEWDDAKILLNRNLFLSELTPTLLENIL